VKISQVCPECPVFYVIVNIKKYIKILMCGLESDNNLEFLYFNYGNDHTISKAQVYE
jgi:hypothetical protein